jgi:hypothetical protein
VAGQGPAPEAPPGSQLVLTDPAGDTSAQLPAGGGQDTVDLRFLAIAETPTQVEFLVGLEKAWTCSQACPDASQVVVRFERGNRTYLLRGGRDVEASLWGALYEGGASPKFLQAADVRLDPERPVFAMALPTGALPDGSGAPPRHGNGLGNVTVAADSRGFLVVPDPSGDWDRPLVSDAMGDPPGAYDFRYGAQDSRGPLLLQSERTFRETNGEPETLRYDVAVTNQDTRTRAYRANATGAPPGWTVDLPRAPFALAAGGRATFPVVVRTSGVHAHGGFGAFRLEVAADDGSALAGLELGVHYLAIPQPSGHHPTIYLHEHTVRAPFGDVNPALGGTNGYLSMNAWEEDGEDARAAVAGFRDGPAPDAVRYHWLACLDPALKVGLDGDLARGALLKLTLSSQAPAQAVAVNATLSRLIPGDPIASCFPEDVEPRLGDLLAAGEGSVGVSSEGSVPLALTPALEYVPFEEGAGLVLAIEATAAPPALNGFGLFLEPGAQLTLPLLEYGDVAPLAQPGEGFAVQGAAPPPPPPRQGIPSPALPLLGAALLLAALARKRLA